MLKRLYKAYITKNEPSPLQQRGFRKAPNNKTDQKESLNGIYIISFFGLFVKKGMV